jgi:hypothetical protein
MLHPVNHLSVFVSLNRDVGHGSRWRGAMPVFLAGGEPDDITGPDLIDRASPMLSPAAPSCDDESLPERMRMPGGARAGFEGYARALHPCRIRRLKKRIDPHGASEPVGWSLAGGLRTSSFNFHFVFPQLIYRQAFAPRGTSAIDQFLEAFRIAFALHRDL